jgi:hypothetical protein
MYTSSLDFTIKSWTIEDTYKKITLKNTYISNTDVSGPFIVKEDLDLLFSANNK